nr:geranylgeranyl reductase family protein [Demequina sediminicola]
MKTQADVIVVGAGPGGSAVAYYLAREGFNVIALEKSRFPREKVCGDGLTPKAVKELQLLNLPTPREDGWIPNWGLRMVGGGHRLEFPWHEQESFPNYGLSLTRSSFDHTLAEHARSAGADIREGWFVTGSVRDDLTGRVIGVTAKATDEKGRKVGDEVTYSAPLVIAADGVSARIALGLGMERMDNRPMGVAVRTYFETPRHDEEWMEGHLTIRDSESHLLPGYGWIFPLGDGTANIGLGTLSPNGAPSGLDHRALFDNWVREDLKDWGIDPDAPVSKVQGAAIPMAFNRQPHYVPGLMLVGDSGGMVSPFNGEGIAYAMQSARRASEAVVAWREARTDGAREAALESYADQMKEDLGGYFSLGRVFAELIDHPSVMRLCTRYGLPRPLVMHFTHKLLADVYEPSGGDWADRLMVTLTKVAPAA